MKIGILGYGKMGKAVEKLSHDLGHETSRVLDSTIDVAIDFTAPLAVKKTAIVLSKTQTPWVLGTTGWNREEVLQIVQDHKIPLLYGPNFSLGMAFFSRLAKTAGSLMEDFYDKVGIEIHHAEKKDAPSGTALKLMEKVPGLTFTSIRSGHHVGTHQVIFDSQEDTVEITHRAKNRDGFAKGAILGAEWLVGKQGIYIFDDFFKERFS
ncbi:MAG: dihydrodipicolinate reductase C-terminal domain-containing protein [Simkaniaceae bacterium]|nr:dihydrodipicolinate reductase C-terminal domain-containing protein [Simkaniaceae bacterium]